MRTLLLGDIHGTARALDQVLRRASFDPAADRLVSLGDICDRGPETDRSIDLLLDVPHLTIVLGNHDEWALGWMRHDRSDPGWLHIGGRETVLAYRRRRMREDGGGEAAGELELAPDDVADIARGVPLSHRALLQGAVDYVIETRPDGRRVLFTHGGWNVERSPDDQHRYELRLYRDFWNQVTTAEAVGDDHFDHGFDAVYLGHTPTTWDRPVPVRRVWNLDQGAAYGGPLTLLDVDTHQHWQSDPTSELYDGQL